MFGLLRLGDLPLGFQVRDGVVIEPQISAHLPKRLGIGQSRVGIVIDEDNLVIHDGVRGACELLGLDPLYVANEGKLVAVVPAAHADALVAAMREDPLGHAAAVIGTVVERDPGLVLMRTAFGTTRIVGMLAGDQLPRIC